MYTIEYIKQKLIIASINDENDEDVKLLDYENAISEHEINIQEIKQLINQIRNRPIKTIKSLCNKLCNEGYIDQSIILGNLLSSNKKEETYLTNYEKNTDKKTMNIVGTFTILGSMTKNKRSQYEIRLYNQESNKSFWCSCPDHKFNSAKKGTCCKHVCMIVCKVAKILDINFFITKKLSIDQYNNLFEKLESRENILSDISMAYIPQENEVFNKITKTLSEDDICPICYDDMNISQGPLSCPSCKNCMHKLCMEVWLERKYTCVYCRSDIWKKYKI